MIADVGEKDYLELLQTHVGICPRHKDSIVVRGEASRIGDAMLPKKTVPIHG